MAKDLTTTKFEPIYPEGLALAMMITTIVMTIVSSIVVSLRFYARISRNAFSFEDWLMLAGWLLNLAHNAAVIVLAFTGVGSPDDIITIGMAHRTGLWTVIWQFIYVLDGAIIKSSIIWTLMRLAKNLNIVYTKILWVLFIFSWIVWQISWPVAIFQCKPVSAAWGRPGDCTSGQSVILNVSYFVSVSNVFTDISTALLPLFLLRHLQMPKRIKFITIGILSLGVFASVATIIRITYTWAYSAKHGRYYEIGKIVTLTVLECDLGIIAGSAPMLRILLRNILPSYGSSQETAAKSRDINLVTIGGVNSRRTHMAGAQRLNDYQENQAADKDSNEDSDSTRCIIRVTHEVEQDTSSVQDGQMNQQSVVLSRK
ncbi:integral membrane protein [Grosmannia clavigera kw1407]|uniref:Integral membrane protein n=1 Tax=Grosmannia clavigera (strain kw1407 / UAMH 11150) TaxID=655863 RepID=F0XB67_GROCL|nr:uncharacterized protein CMQ_5320 [Grosmannia clavigera kw1407]EFX05058.1 integral membrane protein [Grosmannia clavigera kw1407]